MGTLNIPLFFETMNRIDQKNFESTNATTRISRALSLLPFLIISACSEKVASLLDNDNGENFNLDLVDAQVIIEKVPYTNLEAVTDESMDEDSFDGYGVGIFIDDETDGEWKFNKDDAEILVTTDFWCKKALQAINIYNSLELENENCIQDSINCSEIDCSKAELTKKAMILYEEDKVEDEEEVEEAP